MSVWRDRLLAAMARDIDARERVRVAPLVRIGSVPRPNWTNRTNRTGAEDAGQALAERAAVIAEGAKVPLDWARGFAKLESLPPPVGVELPEWLAVVSAAGRFLDQWGAQAAALGWTAEELFGLDPASPLNRLDPHGAAFFLAGANVVEVGPKAIIFRVGPNVFRLCHKSERVSR
jgi:hypothetical protein